MNVGYRALPLKNSVQGQVMKHRLLDIHVSVHYDIIYVNDQQDATV